VESPAIDTDGARVPDSIFRGQTPIKKPPLEIGLNPTAEFAQIHITSPR
jgi:hypothetical protein